MGRGVKEEERGEGVAGEGTKEKGRRKERVVGGRLGGGRGVCRGEGGLGKRKKGLGWGRWLREVFTFLLMP